jgi:preprotein translocase subunit SecE
VPGALDHASGEVDEFDAALVRGAGGVPLDDMADGAQELEAESAASAPGESIRPEVSGRTAAPAAPRRGILSRVVAFLRASWAELQRVQWPDRRHVFQATAVVLGFVVVAGVYLGLADWLAQKIINFVL